MSKMFKQDLVTSTIIFLVVSSGIGALPLNFVHLGQPNYIKAPSGPIKVDTSAIMNSNSQRTDVYITSNLTIPSGQTYIIDNENILIESLTQSQITLDLSGNLYITNSTITILGTAYSVVREFMLISNNGSILNVKNSSLIFAGGISLYGTNATISNSILNTTVFNSSYPYWNSLQINAYNSTVNVYNSTIKGLYNQHGSVEYSDSSLYCYEPDFSQTNKTVPMKVASYVQPYSFVNRVRINMTYVGNSTENSNSLWVYYNGSVIGEYALPYSVNQTSRQLNITLNIAGKEHDLQWMENSSNFRLVTFISYQEPIALSNVTEDMMSNDTVSLYGTDVYSYTFHDSLITFVNSTMGLNQVERFFSTGQPNPYRHSLIADNSTLILGDSNLSSSFEYSSPFFNLANSTLYLFRFVDISLYSNGYTVSNGTYSLTAVQTGSTSVSNISASAFNHYITKSGTGWIYGMQLVPVLYELFAESNASNFTNEFTVNYGNQSGIFSVAPFPVLNRTPMSLSFKVSAPYADFTVTNYTLGNDGNGNATIQYAGNLTGLSGMGIIWSIEGSSGAGFSGLTNISDPGTDHTITIPLILGKNLTAATYKLTLQFEANVPHAFANSGVVNSSFTLSQNYRAFYNAVISAAGLPDGAIWGLRFENSSYFTAGSTINVTFSKEVNATIIPPAGLITNQTVLLLSPLNSDYVVSFRTVTYTVTFSNIGILDNVTWSLIIAGHSYTTIGNRISVSLVPGMYNYQVVGPKGYSVSNSTGIINVSASGEVVLLKSVKDVSLISNLAEHLSQPLYLVPLLIASIILVSLFVWNASHTWYACKKCGSTRKRKRDKCPYCER